MQTFSTARGGLARSLRAALALASVAFLSWGSLELHSAADHGEPFSGHAEVYFPAAAHPGAPHHVEAAGAAAERPPCAACLYELHALAVPATAALATRPADSPRRGPSTAPVLTLARFTGPIRGRAPPSVLS